MVQREFSELQNALENVVIELRVVKDPLERRTLLHQMLQLIVEADAIVKEAASNQIRTSGRFRLSGRIVLPSEYRNAGP